MQWRATSETNLRTRRFDSGVAVYHLPSGNTHLLGDDAARILQILSHRADNAMSLAHSVAASHGILPDESLMQQIDNILADLASLDLIEPVKS